MLTFRVPAACLLFVLALNACTTDPPAQNVWEEAIMAFEEADKDTFPPAGGAVFTGSTSIRLWSTLADEFPDDMIIRRGFGGSEMSDLVHYAHRIITPYAPKLVVVYSGDNDIENEKTPEQVVEDFRALVMKIRSKIPDARVALISIKPSIARFDKMQEMAEANALLKEYIETSEHLFFVDIYDVMLRPDGHPDTTLFVPDGLHLNEAGYTVWGGVLRATLIGGRNCGGLVACVTNPE